MAPSVGPRWLCVLALLTVASAAPAGASEAHRVEPQALRVGETLRYEVSSPRLESAAAAAATTVHPPGGEGLVYLGRDLEILSDAAGLRRIDRFRLRALSPGEIRLRRAVVEGAGETPAWARGGADGPVIRVEPRPGTGVGAAGLVALGVGILAATFFWWRRGRTPEVEPEAGGRAGPDRAVDPLAGCREARLRGDARDFYVRLYAALRERVRAASGRSPRDPRGLAASARDAGLAPGLAEDLRDLAARCERVVFAGDRAPPTECNESFRRAEAIFAGLARPPTQEETP